MKKCGCRSASYIGGGIACTDQTVYRAAGVVEDFNIRSRSYYPTSLANFRKDYKRILMGGFKKLVTLTHTAAKVERELESPPLTTYVMGAQVTRPFLPYP